MTTKGELTICDIWLHSGPIKTFDKFIEGAVNKAIATSNCKVMNKLKYNFNPYGVTAVYILSASHLGYHTYPEHSYVSIDCYTCEGEGSSKRVVTNIINELKKHIKKTKLRTIRRGV